MGRIQRISGFVVGRWGVCLVFFLLHFLYLWLVVDLRLIYHGGGVVIHFPVFYIGWDFARGFISYPGGPVEYIASFLSQFFYIGWAGAVVATVLSLLVYVCTDSIIKAIGGVRLRRLAYIVPVLFLVLYTLYLHHLVFTVALLAEMLFAVLYLRLASKKWLYSSAAFVLISVVLYYLAGGAFLLFAAICVIYEVLFNHRWRAGLFYFLFSAAVPYFEGVTFLDVSIVDAYSNLLPVSWKVMFYDYPGMVPIVFYILYLLLPVLMLVFSLLGEYFRRCSNKSEQAEASSFEAEEAKKTEPVAAGGIISVVIESPLLFVVIFYAILCTYVGRLKPAFALDYDLYYGNWSKALSSIGKQPDQDIASNAAVFALYKTGRLGYDMFLYPQNPNVLFLTEDKYEKRYWGLFDVYLELGFINNAEHELMQAMEKFGERPIILKRLVYINMVKGDSEVAQVYLGALTRTLFDSNWARDWQAKIAQDPELKKDERIQYLRGLILDKDRTFPNALGLSTAADMLLEALGRNGQNRMAFEYLMAHYLQTKQLDKAGETLVRLGEFGYDEIPRLYEEAMLLHGSLLRKQISVPGYEISQQTRERFNNFMSLFHGGSGGRAGFDKLKTDYGNSYFFYYLCKSPGTKK